MSRPALLFFLHAARCDQQTNPKLCLLTAISRYTLPRTLAVHPPAYVFVIDAAVSEDELAACKAAISQALQARLVWI